jgi:hypothetical protein
MSSQLSIFWETPKHMSVAEFRTKLSKGATDSLPTLLFWHEANGKTVTEGVGAGAIESKPKQASETQRAPRKQTNRIYGPKSEADLSNNKRIYNDSMARVRFFHRDRAVGIHFLGADMIAMASKNIAALLDSATQAIGPCRPRLDETDISLGLLSTPRQWVIPTMALKRPTFEFLTEEQYCQRIIEQDIQRQARILGITVPEGFFVKVTHIEDKGSKWVKVGSGEHKSGNMLMQGVEFISNLEFKGNWACGANLSKGFGVILPASFSGKNGRGLK